MNIPGGIEREKAAIIPKRESRRQQSAPLESKKSIPLAGIIWFFLIAIMPPSAAIFYVSILAATQYQSSAGITISDDGQNASLYLPGGSADIGRSGLFANDMLFEYLSSIDLIGKVDKKLNLNELWSKPNSDILFTFKVTDGFGGLTSFWRRNISLRIDTRTGLISLQARAFSYNDSTEILAAIIAECESFIAEQDRRTQIESLAFSKHELNRASTELQKVRTDLRLLRSQAHSVDPRQDVLAQSGVLAELEKRLASALIDMSLLKFSNRAESIKIVRKQLELDAINGQITVQKEIRGSSAEGESSDMPTIVGNYERLETELEFAKSAFQAASQFHFSKLAEASRKKRRLVVYVPLATQLAPFVPIRSNLVILIAVISVLIWAISILAVQSIRSRQ